MNFIGKLFLALTILMFSISTSYCTRLQDVSNDAKIFMALKVLEQTNNQTALKTIKNKKHLKIIFYSLSLLSHSYKDHYALATSDGNGTDYILINSKYKNTPKEALSSLIAHELTHKLAQTTLEEEIQAWMNETKQWIECKKLNPKLSELNEGNHPLVERLNKLEKLYNEAHKKSTLIVKLIKNNSAYGKLAFK